LATLVEVGVKVLGKLQHTLLHRAAAPVQIPDAVEHKPGKREASRCPEQHLSLFSQQMLIRQDRGLGEAGTFVSRFPVRGVAPAFSIVVARNATTRVE